MAYTNRRQMSSNRTLAIVLVALINGVLGYALVQGLAYNVIKAAAEDLKTFDVEDEPPPPPDEPPPPPDAAPPPPQVAAPPPLVRIDSPSPPLVTTPVINPNPPITPVARPAPPAPPAPPPPRVSQAAKAKGSLLSLIGDDDYPQAAIRNEEQGTTAVRLAIGTDGRVSDCSITQSSGSASLDNATCSVFRRRARFTPARDQAGNPIGDSYSQRVKWVLPAE